MPRPSLCLRMIWSRRFVSSVGMLASFDVFELLASSVTVVTPAVFAHKSRRSSIISRKSSSIVSVILYYVGNIEALERYAKGNGQ